MLIDMKTLLDEATKRDTASLLPAYLTLSLSKLLSAEL